MYIYFERQVQTTCVVNKIHGRVCLNLKVNVTMSVFGNVHRDSINVSSMLG